MVREGHLGEGTRPLTDCRWTGTTAKMEASMIVIQVVPRDDRDVYRMLRSKVIHEATTWYWSNKAKTRLKHVRSDGYIEVGGAGGVLVAHVYPRERSDLFYLLEKFMGRLVAWFEEDMAAINVQFVPDPKRRKKR